jgi:hypothetical protein
MGDGAGLLLVVVAVVGWLYLNYAAVDRAIYEWRFGVPAYGWQTVAAMAVLDLFVVAVLAP